MYWHARSGTTGAGRIAARLASRHLSPYHQMSSLAWQLPRGFISPRAHVAHPELQLGQNTYLGDGVIVYSTAKGGPVEIGDRVHFYGESFVETGMGGRISIGDDTHVQPGCHIHAYLSEIRIGRKVEIAPECAFYCYDHGVAPGIPIMDQPLTSKGPIHVGDYAWIGHRATILQNVTIGEGAVVAAGAVVVKDVPANAIVAGVPAKVIGHRGAA
jgi:acetyltransferase-like isoleucine patch superfamily enzyme